VADRIDVLEVIYAKRGKIDGTFSIKACQGNCYFICRFSMSNYTSVIEPNWLWPKMGCTSLSFHAYVYRKANWIDC